MKFDQLSASFFIILSSVVSEIRGDAHFLQIFGGNISATMLPKSLYVVHGSSVVDIDYEVHYLTLVASLDGSEEGPCDETFADDVLGTASVVAEGYHVLGKLMAESALDAMEVENPVLPCDVLVAVPQDDPDDEEVVDVPSGPANEEALHVETCEFVVDLDGMTDRLNETVAALDVAEVDQAYQDEAGDVEVVHARPVLMVADEADVT